MASLVEYLIALLGGCLAVLALWLVSLGVLGAMTWGAYLLMTSFFSPLHGTLLVVGGVLYIIIRQILGLVFRRASKE